MEISKPVEAIEIQVILCDEEEEKGSTVGSPFVVDILSLVGGEDSVDSVSNLIY